MGTTPCATIRDFISLYIEGELSDESQKLVSGHLETCPECRKLYEVIKRSGSEQSEAMYSSEKSEPQTDTIKKWVRWAALGFAIILAIVTFGVMDKDQNLTVVKMASKDELQAYLYKKIPGLKRAEALGHVDYPNKTVNIPKLDADMQLESIWYTKDLVYVIYSIGNIVPDKANAVLKWTSDQEIKVMSDLGNMNIGEGALYDGRFYSTFTFSNVKENRSPSSKKTELSLEVCPTFTVHKQQVKTENIPLTTNYDPAWDTPLFLSMKGDLPLLEGTIKIKGLELTPTQSYLYFNFDHPGGKQIYHIISYVTCGNGDKRRIWAPLQSGMDKARYKASFDALDTIPNKFTLAVERAVLVGDEKYNFTIDATKYRYKESLGKNKKIINRHIKTIDNTDISLEKIFWDERGIHFEILYKHDPGLKPPYTVLTTGNISDAQGRGYSVMSIRSKTEVERFRQKEGHENWPFPNLVTAYNEKGEPAEYGQRGSGPGDRMGMFLDLKFTEASKTIYVQVDNLAQLLVGEWKIEVTTQ